MEIVWDPDKAAANPISHAGVTFEEAKHVLFDPFALTHEDDSSEGEQRFVTLGTDGYGRSDSREALRSFFEVDKYYVVLAALKSLADEGKLPASKAAEAIKKYKLDATKPNPTTI